MNSGIEQRGLYMGSTLMADKFQRVRNLQQFELREKQFLRQFRKRIHESYFTNNANWLTTYIYYICMFKINEHIINYE